MASSKSSATICDLFLIFNLLFFTFGTSFLVVPKLRPLPSLATSPRRVQPGCCHTPAPPPASPPSGNGGHGEPTPHPMTPPASPPSGNGGHGEPTPHPITPPASPPSGNGHGGPSPPAIPPSSGHCPVKPISFEGCNDVLHGSVDLNGQCCRLVNGSAGINAPLCLCTAIRAGSLKVNGTNNDVAISQIITRCEGPAPQGFRCLNETPI
ncbi:Bifunctional inhibitor/lipid-transfer protein/seed storage 2S albumin protein [Dioscorea alata]|uniref:Bifunctional inhibitor/lipid-transfer protein/seed storage 2S albumin protein n=1 Tax=Dioscorea alata TaxID=55571 RepID=A0ACB7UGV9_DIOAL|nr:Bifunctional inhibitor/lipid-transfer protein/seed storage 2S albumin protein [Dioscorea alata]